MRRNKRFLCICICLILALGLFHVQAMAEAETPAWVSAYDQVLTEWKSQVYVNPDDFDIVPELSYLVYDIDKDGTPEMIIKTGTCEADYHGWIYIFRDGRAFQVGEALGFGHSSFTAIPAKTGSS